MIADNNNEQIIVAGFGGQGIILMGKLLAQAAMEQNFEITYIPSYGAEVRGGTSNCKIIISSEPIACPVVDHPTALIIMNQASLDRFLPRLLPQGLLIYNTSLIDTPPDRDDIDTVALPADQIALDIGNTRCANMVALGAYLQKSGMIAPAAAAQCLPRVLAPHRHNMITLNEKAILAGADFLTAPV